MITIDHGRSRLSHWYVLRGDVVEEGRVLAGIDGRVELEQLLQSHSSLSIGRERRVEGLRGLDRMQDRIALAPVLLMRDDAVIQQLLGGLELGVLAAWYTREQQLAIDVDALIFIVSDIARRRIERRSETAAATSIGRACFSVA